MMTKAVIDRFEGDVAVVLVGEERQRMDILRKLLPKKAKEGQWLQLDISNGEVTGATIDLEETARAKERIAEKLASLRRGDHRK